MRTIGRTRVAWVAIVVVLLSCRVATAAVKASILWLDDIPDGLLSGRAFGVSDDGSVVVGQGSPPGGPTAPTQWVNGVLQPLELPFRANNSVAYAVSNDGSTAVGGGNDPFSVPSYASRWVNGGPPISLLSNTFLYGGVARGTNGDGSVIVGLGVHNNPQIGPNSYEAFRWTAAAGMIPLGDLPGGAFVSDAHAVTPDGTVVVGVSDSGYASGQQQAFRWTAAGGMIGLGDLPGGYEGSFASDVSDDGTVVVGSSVSGPDSNPANARREPFRWTAQTGMVGLGTLDGISTFASACSGDGSIIVGTTEGNRAIIWDQAHGVRLLRDVLVEMGVGGLPLPTTLWEANGISSDGQWIVGTGQHGGGFQAFVAHSPEPASAFLAAAISIAPTLRRRTRLRNSN
jgi:probable HAF family extracellular repeat protein